MSLLSALGTRSRVASLAPVKLHSGNLFSITQAAFRYTQAQSRCRHRAAIALTPPQSAGFSSTSVALAKRKKGGREQQDLRVKLIRYFLYHPRLPRPLRLSRLRTLRHWTIHRAWQLFRKKQLAERELELERQYNSMREACEALRLVGDDGMEDGKNVGRLYRDAMHKRGVWDGVPIEYARAQTDYPPRDGWDHAWKR